MSRHVLPLLFATMTAALGAGPTADWFINPTPPAAIYHDGWTDLNKNGVKDAYEDPTLTPDQRIDDLLARMTLEEKTAQMVTLYGFPRVLKDQLPTEPGLAACGRMALATSTST